MDKLIGTDLGRYHIVELLGEGGMSTVYKAMDTSLEREVAIKIIRRSAFPPDQLQDILKRFEREAKILAKLSHPNIVKVYDYGEYEGSPYLVLEYLPGGTLKKRLIKLKGKPVPWQEAVQLLSPIMRALDFAHSKEMIHRDVKPSNILLSDSGEAMLSDFGIAKLFGSEETASLTNSGIGMGTPEYMAPEQWTGKASPQSDQYSVGVILYEMITGRKPYEADTPAALLLKQATQPMPSPRTFQPGLPSGLEKALLKALSNKPEDRYPDAATFAQTLKNLDENRKPTKSIGDKKVKTTRKKNDDATVDHLAGKSVAPKKTVETKIQAKQDRRGNKVYKNTAKSGPVSRRWIWIPIAILIGMVVLVGLVYKLNLLGHIIPAKPAAPTILSTVISAPDISTPTPEPTLETPTASPLSTSTATSMPTNTKVSVKRTIITTENGKGLALLQSFQSSTTDQIRWTSDNRYLVVASPSGIHIYDSNDFSTAGSINPPVRDVYLSNDGSLVAYFQTTKTLRVQNVVDQTIRIDINIPPHNGSITDAVFSQDDKLIAVGTSIGTITVWTIADGSLYSTLEMPNTYVRSMAFSQDSSELISGSGASRSTDYSVRLWNVAEKILEHTVTVHQSPVTYLFISPDNSIVASGSNEGGVYLWNVSDEIRVVKKIDILRVNFEHSIESMAFSPDGTLFTYAIPYQTGHAIILAEASSGTMIKTIDSLSGPIRSLAFSVDNSTLASADDNSIKIWGIP